MFMFMVTFQVAGLYIHFDDTRARLWIKAALMYEFSSNPSRACFPSQSLTSKQVSKTLLGGGKDLFVQLYKVLLEHFGCMQYNNTKRSRPGPRSGMSTPTIPSAVGC